MWQGDKLWIQYDEEIMASDVADALFLKAFLRHTGIFRLYTQYFDIIDLQRYKVYREPKKVRSLINERSKVPFVFIAGKN